MAFPEDKKYVLFQKEHECPNCGKLCRGTRGLNNHLKHCETIDITSPETWPFVLNTQNVMEITKMGKNKVLDLLQSGELPAKRVRGRWLINRDTFINWLKS